MVESNHEETQSNEEIERAAQLKGMSPELIKILQGSSNVSLEELRRIIPAYLKAVQSATPDVVKEKLKPLLLAMLPSSDFGEEAIPAMAAFESSSSPDPEPQNAPPQPSSRILGFIRFYINTIKEALLHPLSTSTLDKRTGRVIARNGQSLLFNN